jgi:hypothetical protein
VLSDGSGVLVGHRWTHMWTGVRTLARHGWAVSSDFCADAGRECDGRHGQPFRKSAKLFVRGQFLRKLGVCHMKKLNLIGRAIVALVVTPIFAASTASAQSRKKNVGTISSH